MTYDPQSVGGPTEGWDSPPRDPSGAPPYGAPANPGPPPPLPPPPGRGGPVYGAAPGDPAPPPPGQWPPQGPGGYGPQTGYGAPPGGYQQPPGYPPPPGYGTPPGYGYQPPGYGYQPPPGYGPPARRTDGTAVAALVLAIGSFVFCPGVLAVIALFLASSARKTIEQSGGMLEGGSLVTAAKIIAWINIGLVILFLAILAIGAIASNTSTSNGLGIVVSHFV